MMDSNYIKKTGQNERRYKNFFYYSDRETINLVVVEVVVVRILGFADLKN